MARYSKIREARALPHASAKNNWRLKSLEHIVDPCFSQGMYAVCHSDARNNKKLLPHTLIIDLVGKHGCGDFRYVRSMFIVNKIKNGIWYYSQYWFCDGCDPIEYPKKITRSRYGVRDDAIIWLKKIEADCNYNKYPSGQRPKSIATTDWEFQKRLELSGLRKRYPCGLSQVMHRN